MLHVLIHLLLKYSPYSKPWTLNPVPSELMPAKKASKPKRKSSSSTLTKYSRSRPLGPELKWFDVNTPNSIVGFGSYANPSSQHCPFWHWTEPAYRSYHRGQRNRNQDQHASSLGLCRSHSPFSRWHQLSCRSHSGQASKRGGAPWSRHLRHTRCRCISRKSVHELAQQ